MPVDSTHPLYDQHLPLWTKCRTVIEGEDAVKAAGTDFLPRLEEQEDGDYEAYKSRAFFYNASDRTVRGLTGAVMRKEAEVVFPERNVSLLDNLGSDGKSLKGMARCLVEEDVGIGRVGLLVDAPEKDNALPFVSVYFAENIINWRVVRIGGRERPVFVALSEKVWEPAEDDPYQLESKNQIRVLRLDLPDERLAQDFQLTEKEAKDLVYIQEVWREKDPKKARTDKEKYERISEIVPKMRGGRPLSWIPFVCINPDGIGFTPVKSPALDLINANLSHYRNSADHEHGLHFTALPTAWVAGFDDKSTKLRIGSQTAWVSSEPGATAGYLEFTGAGLASIAANMDRKEKIMAVLGARLLEQQPGDAESGVAIRLRQSGETSALASISMAVSEGLSLAMQWVAQWLGHATALDKVGITLTTDFDVSQLDPQQLVGLMGAVQQGLISWNTWFYNIQAAELIPDGITMEDEAKLIAAGPPMGTVLPPPAPGDEEDEEPEEEGEEAEEAA